MGCASLVNMIFLSVEYGKKKRIKVFGFNTPGSLCHAVVITSYEIFVDRLAPLF